MEDARTMTVQELRERVALDEYVVESDKVASAILSRLLAVRAARPLDD
jgi:anti-sigma28 factor (negative regulator of flagellin synthesis)